MATTRKFIRYASRVPTLIDAWALVMEHVDEFQSPNIEILGVFGADEADDENHVMFDVSVYGDVEGGW